MTDTIKKHLAELEQERNIKILLAVESGSRAWGFPSPDSDYDVRIFYLHPKDWYLSIQNRKDTIEYFHGELLDISGWDIRKALSLLGKSNSTPAEWCQSPIVYKEAPGFKEQLFQLVQQYFQPDYMLNHYIGIAKNTLNKNPLDAELRLKKLFYIIRPALAATWIVEKETVPPMDIWNLLEVAGNDRIKNEIEDLINVKSTANEDFLYTPSLAMHTYLTEKMEEITAASMSKRPKQDYEPLNIYFRNLIA